MAATGPEIAAAARPALRLDDLPVDLLAHVVSYAGRVIICGVDGQIRKAVVGDFLALRLVCNTCQDAVRRAAKEHPVLDEASFRLSDGSTARAIAAWGQMFGSGCRELHFYTSHKASDIEPSDEALDALQSFVVNTQGRLRQLNLTSLGFSKSRDYALELCRASPQLKELVLTWIDSCFGTEHVVTSAAMESFAMEVGRLCPLLEYVRLSAGIGGEIPAETWQQHFPRLKTLEFQGRPENYAAIEAAARACVCAEEVSLVECDDELPAFVDMLLRTPLRGRLRKLDLGFDLPVSNEVILQCARFEGLRFLRLPPECAIDVEFCRSLAQLRPTLTGLDLGTECRADDECLRILCESLSLEHLTFSSMEWSLSPAVIDIILQSSSAQTLRGIGIYYMDELFTPANLLRLVRGCPLLSEFEGDSGELLSPIEHGKTVKAINKLLKGRGGKKNQYRPFVDFGPSQWGRPDTLGGQAGEFLQANEESEDDSESGSGED